MAGHNQWHVSGWPAILAAPIVLPLARIAGALGLLRDKPANLTPFEVGRYLDDFLNYRGKPCDWDDFTSITLADPILDDIRQEAANVRLPVDAYGEKTLVGLLDRVRALENVR